MSIPDLPLTFWFAAIAAVILIGIAKAGFGSGVAVIATPLLALVIPVADAAALLLPLLIMADILSVRHYRGEVDKPSITALLPAALVGIVLGALVFDLFAENERVLKVGIGIISIVFVVYQVSHKRIADLVVHRRPSRPVGIALGVTAGFSSTLAHAGGPLATIYLLPQNLPRNIFVGTSAIFFLIVNVVKLVPYSMLGLLRIGNLVTILLLVPFAFLGVWLGVRLNRSFTDVWFNRVIYAMLFVTGMQLILGTSLISLVAG